MTERLQAVASADESSRVAVDGLSYFLTDLRCTDDVTDVTAFALRRAAA